LNPRASASAERHEPLWLLLIATLVLFVFYHFLRADGVGVYSPRRGWTALIPPRLDPRLHFLGSGLILGVVPAIAARRLTRFGFDELGLGLGRWRLGLRWLAVGVPLAILAGRLSAPSPDLRAVYPLDPSLSPVALRMLAHALGQGAYFLGWEVLFRGVLLFGLRRRVGGPTANMVQTALSVLAHFGRPLPETLAAIPAGLVFGAIDLRIGSMWYLAVVHWVVGASVDWWIVAG